MLVILACAASANTGIFPGEERKKIASFILVKSIPVSIDSKDSFLGVALQGLINVTLKAMGYRFIAHEVARTNFSLTKKKREWLISYEDSELVTTIAARIVDSLTAR